MAIKIYLVLQLIVNTVMFSVLSPSQVSSEVSDLANEAISAVSSMQNLQQQLEAYVNENRQGDAVWSVAVMIPDSSLEIVIGDEPQTAASTVKLFVCGAIMENLQYLVGEQEEDEQTLKDLIYSTLTVSDNEAASSLIAVLGNGDTTRGKEVVNDYMAKHGYDHSYVGILFSGVDPTGTYNATTAEDSAKFMIDLLEGNLAGSELLLQDLAESQRMTKIPAAIPETVKTANKTGELAAVENDTCIVYGDKQTFVLSIMLDTMDNTMAVEHIHNITEIVYNALEGDGAVTISDEADIDINAEDAGVQEDAQAYISTDTGYEESLAVYSYDDPADSYGYYGYSDYPEYSDDAGYYAYSEPEPVYEEVWYD